MKTQKEGIVTPKHNLLQQNPIESDGHIGNTRQWPTGKRVPRIIPGPSQMAIIALII